MESIPEDQYRFFAFCLSYSDHLLNRPFIILNFETLITNLLKFDAREFMVTRNYRAHKSAT